MSDLYKVYIKINDANRITSVNSSAFISDPIDWIKIDEGYGDRCHHAQCNYFAYPIMDDRGIYRYVYVPKAKVKWRERTQEEMDADYVPPALALTADERMDQIEAALIEIAALL